MTAVCSTAWCRWVQSIAEAKQMQLACVLLAGMCRARHGQHVLWIVVLPCKLPRCPPCADVHHCKLGCRRPWYAHIRAIVLRSLPLAALGVQQQPHVSAAVSRGAATCCCVPVLRCVRYEQHAHVHNAFAKICKTFDGCLGEFGSLLFSRCSCVLCMENCSRHLACSILTSSLCTLNLCASCHGGLFRAPPKCRKAAGMKRKRSGGSLQNWSRPGWGAGQPRVTATVLLQALS